MLKTKAQNSISGDMASSINEVCKLYKALSLYKNDVYFKGNTTEETIALSKRKKYKETYDSAIKNLDYDILLSDDSFFHFTCDADRNKRYVFFQSPYQYRTFQDFISIMFEIDDIPKTEEGINELWVSMENDYEQWLSEMGLNEWAVYLRYDIDYKNYTPNIHSYTHLHIGMGTDIRIPFSICLTPLSFSLLVLKHVYKNTWEAALRDNDLRNRIYSIPKGSRISRELWQDAEEKDFYIK